MQNYQISPDATLKLGRDTPLSDGTYFAIAVWTPGARDYLDIPGLYSSESAARSARDKMQYGGTGTRTIRYTVHKGAVTTRRGLT